MIDPEEKIRRVELMPPNPEWATQFENAASEIKAILDMWECFEQKN